MCSGVTLQENSKAAYGSKLSTQEIHDYSSDFAGLGQGFRGSNMWLAVLTHSAPQPRFYAGDAWGSFNSIMRLLAGVFFGMGIVWFSFPYVEDALGVATPPNS